MKKNTGANKRLGWKEMQRRVSICSYLIARMQGNIML